MKGIILAGGLNIQLYPVALAMSKQLLPVYDKSMIYHPLLLPMLAGIREILVISPPEDLSSFHQLLGKGERWGSTFRYVQQLQPLSLVDAFLVERKFLSNEPCCLILGDKILYGTGLWQKLQEAVKIKRGALIFAYPVRGLSSSGIVEFDNTGRIVGLEDKSAIPRSRYAVPSYYFYDDQVCGIASSFVPSTHIGIDITDINRYYLENDQLNAQLLSCGAAWFTRRAPMNISRMPRLLYNQ